MVADTESLGPPRHLLVYCRLPHHTAPSPSSLLGGSSTASSPERQAHGSNKPLGSSSSWGISLASSLGLSGLSTHLLGVLLRPVQCHPLTRDAESPCWRCERENLPPPFCQAFCIWIKAAVESLRWVVSKAKKKNVS